MSLIRYIRARLESLLVGDSEFVDRAFREILGRDADHGGLEFYRGVLRQGVGRTSVLLDIMRSEEFRRTLVPAVTTSFGSSGRTVGRYPCLHVSTMLQDGRTVC